MLKINFAAILFQLIQTFPNVIPKSAGPTTFLT